MTAIAPDFPSAALSWLPELSVSMPAGGYASWLWKGSSSSPSFLAAEVSQVLSRIDEVAAEARHFNWDGERGLPVAFSTREFARRFVLALPAGTTLPEVSVDRDGDIALDWDFGPRRVLSISVARDGVLHFAGLFGANKQHGSEVFLRGVPPAVAQLIRRVEVGT